MGVAVSVCSDRVCRVRARRTGIRSDARLIWTPLLLIPEQRQSFRSSPGRAPLRHPNRLQRVRGPGGSALPKSRQGAEEAQSAFFLGQSGSVRLLHSTERAGGAVVSRSVFRLAILPQNGYLQRPGLE